MKKVFALVAAAALSLTLFGCGGGANAGSNMAGSYKIDRISDGTNEYSGDMIDTIGMSDVMTMEIGEDNTGVISVFGTNCDIAIDPENNKVTLNVNDNPETIDCKIEDGKVTFDIEGQSVTMAKR